MRQSKGQIGARYVFLIIGAFLILSPLYITIITPFKTPMENAKSFFTFPRTFYTENFTTILTSPRYYRALLNTIYVTVFTLVGSVMVMPMMSYAIARSMKHRRLYRIIYYYILLGIFIPFQVKMMPLAKLMFSLKLLNPTGLAILAIGASACEATFLYVGYFSSIPAEIEEAAHIDGASTRKTFTAIIIPLITPMISTIMIKDGLWMWNDFMMPLIVLNRSWKHWTLTLFQYNFKTEYTTDYGLSFATLVLSILPIMIFYTFMQKHIISGLTSGSVKN
jgi:raffinose/stachyose/melibiose transport system permease protein